MRFKVCLSATVLFAASTIAMAQSKVPMFDPLFAISYDPQVTHFEQAPETIGRLCKDLRGRKLWIYAEWRDKETTYYIVSGFIVNHPDGPGKGDVSPDEDGVAVAIQGEKCTTDDAVWTLSGWSDTNPAARLPEAFPESLPGKGAPRVCDKSGSCHYAVRSLHAQSILEGLASDALERFSKAFGGKKEFLDRIQKTGAHLDIPPVLRHQLDEYRKGK